MNKGLINMYRYLEIALAANEHYLNALSAVENPVPVYCHVEKITEPVVKAGRSYSGFNQRAAWMSNCSRLSWMANPCHKSSLWRSPFPTCFRQIRQGRQSLSIFGRAFCFRL